MCKIRGILLRCNKAFEPCINGMVSFPSSLWWEEQGPYTKNFKEKFTGRNLDKLARRIKENICSILQNDSPYLKTSELAEQ